MVWYASALVGLSSWGRVATWPMIKTYVGQSYYLVESLGYSPWLLGLPIFLVLLAVGGVGRSRFLKPDWTIALFHLAAPRSATLLAVLLAIFPVILFVMIDQAEVLHEAEPIELSFYPRLGVKREGNAYAVPASVKQDEKNARDSYSPAKEHKRRNVILIVGDALRADHMGVYGYSRNNTPHLSSLATSQRGEVVRQVRSVCAESMCGYTALASSRPVQLAPQNPFTLHEALRRNGYKVHMIMSGDHTNFYGLREMYGDVDSYFDGSGQPIRWGGKGQTFLRYVNDDQLVIDKVAELPDSSDSESVMLQIVLMSSHGLGPRHERNLMYKPSLNYYSFWGKTVPRLDTSARQAVYNFYDNGVFQLDGYIGEILKQLRHKGYLNDALVVITGDHGELLGEFDSYSHGIGVREPVLNIPLIFSRFGYDAEKFPPRKLVSQIDIAPTILTELGLPVPSTWQGVPLQTLVEGRSVYFQQAAEAGIYVVDGSAELLKYWHDFGNGQDFLFDIASDAGEQRNLTAGYDKAKLASWRLQVAHGGLQVGKDESIDILMPLFDERSDSRGPVDH